MAPDDPAPAGLPAAARAAEVDGSAVPRERWSRLLGEPSQATAAPTPRRRPLRPWVPAAALAGLAIVLGTIGSLMTGYGPEDSRPLTHALYNAVRCFSLNGPADGDLAWPLDVARFLAPLATVWAAVAAFLGVTAASRRERRVLAAGGHTLVCGLTPAGLALARETLALGEAVVALEPDPSHPAARHLGTLGAVVLHGDPAEPALLARAGLARARRVLATQERDRDNLSLAAAVLAAAPARAPGEPPLDVLAQCDDADLAQIARRGRILESPVVGVRVELFSRDEAAARVLATDHLAPLFARAARAGRVPHVALVGLDPTGEAVLRRLLGMPAVSSLPALEVTALDPHAAASLARLETRLPWTQARNGLGDLCRLRALDEPCHDAHALLERLRRLHAERALDAVIVCRDEVDLVWKAALEARGAAAGLPPCFLSLRQGDGLLALLGSAAPQGVTLFGEDHEACSRAVVVHGSLDALARRLHEVYREVQPADAPVPGWDDLDAERACSNADQADHVPFKLAVLGRAAMRGASPPDPLSPDELEALARLEHARWLAERVLAGWRHAPGPKDVARRTSPSLVAWEDLPEPARELARESVRHLGRHLARMGLTWSRAHAPGAPGPT